MAAATAHGKGTEGKMANVERITEDPCCKKCFILETKLKETTAELKSAQLIIQLLRNEVIVGTKYQGSNVMMLV